MKMMIALALALAGMTANAFDFSPGPTYSCGTYCTGYVTTDPTVTVDYANLRWTGSQYQTVLSLNGKVFSGYSPGTAINGPLYASDGTFVTLTNETTSYKRTCTTSGRGQHCTSWFWVVSGTATP
jgi:hypothetical protein